MNKLKLKSLVYKYTGIYLAKREEQAFLDEVQPSSEFSENLLRGTWQATNGFGRPNVRYFFIHRFRYPKLKYLFSFMDNVLTFCIVVKWDLESLWNEIKRK